MKISCHALLLVLASFAAGIACTSVAPPSFAVAALSSLGCLLLWAVAIARSQVTPVALLPLFFCLGLMAGLGIATPKMCPAAVRLLFRPEPAVVLARVDQVTPLEAGHTRLLLRLKGIKTEGRLIPARGRIFLLVGAHGGQIAPGQQVVARARFRPLRSYRNPGSFDYRGYQAARHVWARGYSRDLGDLICLQGRRQPGLLDTCRRRYRSFVSTWLERDEAAGLRALVLGERGDLSDARRDSYAAAGISHILAVSGLHLGMVAAMGALLAYWPIVRIPCLVRRWPALPLAVLAALLPTLLYACLTGLQLPTLRAMLMLAAVAVALALGRHRDLLNSLYMAAIFILVASPASLFRASFQLSFVAVAALLVSASPEGQRRQQQVALPNPPGWWPRCLQKLATLWRASLATSCACAPLVLYHFHLLAPLSPLVNLVVIPLVGLLILPAGLLSLLLLSVSESMAGLALTFAGLGLHFLHHLVAAVNRVPGSALYPGTPAIWLALLATAAVFAVLLLHRRLQVAGVIVAAIAITLLWRLTAPRPGPTLAVTYLDVGQGSSAVVRLPGGGAILIDGGGQRLSKFDPGRALIAPFLWQKRITRLRAVVLSHPHPDHFLGLRYILAHFPTGEFWYTNVYIQDEAYDKLLLLAKARAIPRVKLSRGQQLKIDGVSIQVLHPPAVHPDTWAGLESVNDLSLVLRLTYGRVSFLFPGDIGRRVEHQLCAQPDLAATQVILACHHGSAKSNSLALLTRLQPEVVIFSVGSGYGFNLPAAAAVERYQGVGARSYRTDHCGAITVNTDGTSVWIQTFAATPRQ